MPPTNLSPSPHTQEGSFSLSSWSVSQEVLSDPAMSLNESLSLRTAGKVPITGSCADRGPPGTYQGDPESHAPALRKQDVPATAPATAVVTSHLPWLLDHQDGDLGLQWPQKERRAGHQQLTPPPVQLLEWKRLFRVTPGLLEDSTGILGKQLQKCPSSKAALTGVTVRYGNSGCPFLSGTTTHDAKRKMSAWGRLRARGKLGTWWEGDTGKRGCSSTNVFVDKTQCQRQPQNRTNMDTHAQVWIGQITSSNCSHTHQQIWRCTHTDTVTYIHMPVCLDRSTRRYTWSHTQMCTQASSQSHTHIPSLTHTCTHACLRTTAPHVCVD